MRKYVDVYQILLYFLIKVRCMFWSHFFFKFHTVKNILNKLITLLLKADIIFFKIAIKKWDSDFLRVLTSLNNDR